MLPASLDGVWRYKIAGRSFAVNPRLGLVCLAALSITSAPARADIITTLFNTGVDINGTKLADGAIDPRWSIVTNPDGTGTQAFVSAASEGLIGNSWIGEQIGAAWIQPTSGTTLNHAAGTYTYQTTFDMTGFDPTATTIRVRIAADNRVSGLILNGHNLGFTYDGPLGNGDAFDALSDAFSINTPSFFNSGLNTLQFQITNDPIGGAAGGNCYDNNAENPTGMLVLFSVDTQGIPEPSTYAMVGAAMGLFGLRRRFARNKTS
jgi:hypothetical protein